MKIKLISIIQYVLFFITLSFSKNLRKEDTSEDDYNSQITEEIKNLVQQETSPLHHSAYDRLAYIVDTYGPRLWGGPQLELVIDDLIGQAKKLEFDSVYKDPVTNFNKWVRREESLTLYDPRPYPQKLNLIGLGKSVPGDIKAEVIVVTGWENLIEKKLQIKGKIVCYAVPWVDYITTVQFRTLGAVKAAEFGAVGVLIRSVTPFSIDSPHTGSMQYEDKVRKIPAAAISVEDANMLLRMYNRGQKIVVHLKLDSEEVPGANSSNVIAEIKGRENPEEIVLFGGHMDSWDTGSQTGANDDGGGFITCFEALRVIKHLGLKPRRTMRFIGWSGEEYGGNESGAVQYIENRKDEIKNHVIAFESDLGSNKPYGFGFSGNQKATKTIENIAKTNFQSTNTTFVNDEGVMVDNGKLYIYGVPNMRNLIQDFNVKTYPFQFTFHHSAGDSMDIMNPDFMDDNVIMIASMMFNIADRKERLSADYIIPPSTPK